MQVILKTIVVVVAISAGFSHAQDELIGEIPFEYDSNDIDIWEEEYSIPDDPSIAAKQMLLSICDVYDLTLNEQSIDCSNIELSTKNPENVRHNLRKREADDTPLEGSGEEPHEPAEEVKLPDESHTTPVNIIPYVEGFSAPSNDSALPLTETKEQENTEQENDNQEPNIEEPKEEVKDEEPEKEQENVAELQAVVQEPPAVEARKVATVEEAVKSEEPKEEEEVPTVEEPKIEEDEAAIVVKSPVLEPEEIQILQTTAAAPEPNQDTTPAPNEPAALPSDLAETEAKPEEKVEEKPEEKAEEKPEGNAEEKPEETLKETPEVKKEEAPVVTAEEKSPKENEESGPVDKAVTKKPQEVEKIDEQQSGIAIVNEHFNEHKEHALEGSDSEKAVKNMEPNADIKAASNEQPNAGESAKDIQKASKDTTVLVVLFAIVVAVGVLAFAYNYVRKQKKRRAANIPVAYEGHVKNSDHNGKTDVEQGTELKPLIKNPDQKQATEYSDRGNGKIEEVSEK